MAKKFLIILNPTAGKGKAAGQQAQVEDFFKTHKVDYEIALTKSPGDAINIARNYKQDKDTAIIAGGGDGTCNEVANGLLEKSPTPKEAPLFGVLPLGRGNDFSYSAKTPGELDKALDVLINGNTILMDAGKVVGGYFPEGRYFINGIGIGFDTMVGLEAAKLKNVHSSLTYTIGALKTLIRFAPSPHLEIRFNNKTVKTVPVQVSLMNGRRMGGIFFMGPYAELNDGLLDI